MFLSYPILGKLFKLQALPLTVSHCSYSDRFLVKKSSYTKNRRKVTHWLEWHFFTVPALSQGGPVLMYVWMPVGFYWNETQRSMGHDRKIASAAVWTLTNNTRHLHFKRRWPAASWQQLACDRIHEASDKRCPGPVVFAMACLSDRVTQASNRLSKHSKVRTTTERDTPYLFGNINFRVKAVQGGLSGRQLGLGWLLFVPGCSTVSPILLGLVGNWQKRLGN